MLRQIRGDQIKQGMYIAGFGGSWFDHPFWRAKFLIETPEDVERVRGSGVPYVLIDDERGVGVEEAPNTGLSLLAPAASPVRILNRAKPARWPIAIDEDGRSAARRRAIALVSLSKKVVRGVFDDARLGRAIQVASVVSIVDEIAASVAYSPQTLLTVTRLKNKDEYTYLHSVAVCTLMVSVARHLDLDDAEVRDLGLAGLLHDIGKMGTPESILNKPGQLTDEEFQNIREHPEHGYKLLCGSPEICETALDVCRHHHEKIDGTGYPFGLPANAITFAARLGAICDVYDALTSDRVYKEAWSTEKAISEMWRWEGHFDSAILFTFMQAVEIYPPGMLVQLRTNRLAIILAKKRRNSRPRALAFYSTREREFLEPEIVIIGKGLGGEQVLSAENPANWGLTDWDSLSERLTA
jgi:putative nucleotidyltransferase with HDIG domain